MFQAKYNNTNIIPKDYLPSIHQKNIHCPYCDNSMIFINGIKNKKHFRHVNSNKKCIIYDKINKINFLRESKEHLDIKNELYNYFKNFLKDTDNVFTEYTIGGYDNIRRADIFIEYSYNKKKYKTIIEVQLSYNNFKEINDRTNFYKKHGIDNVIWICTTEASGLTLNFNEVQKYIIYYIEKGILGYAYNKNNYSEHKNYSFYHKKLISEKQKINKNNNYIEKVKLNNLGYDFLISGKSIYIEQKIVNYNKQEDFKIDEYNKKIKQNEKKLHENIKRNKIIHRTNSNYSYSTPPSLSTNKTFTPYEEELNIDFKLKLENSDISDKEILIGDYVIVNNNINILKEGLLKKFHARQYFYRVKKIDNGFYKGNSDIKEKIEYGYCRNGFKKEELIRLSKECYIQNFGNH